MVAVTGATVCISILVACYAALVALVVYDFRSRTHR